MTIMAAIPGMDRGITRDIQVQVLTQAMVLRGMATRARSPSRLAIDRITRVAPAITQAAPIMCGGQDIGYTVTVVESGSTVTTR